MKTYNKATLKDRIAINDFLKDNIEKGDDSLWAYKNGFSDASVAAHMTQALGHTISGTMIANVRKEIYGDLRRATGGEMVEAMKSQIVTLSTYVDKALKDNAALKERVIAAENAIVAIKLALKHKGINL